MGSALDVELTGRRSAAALDSPAPLRRLRAICARAARALRSLPRSLAVLWSRVPVERLFWIWFVFLLFLFALLLVVQPTGAGRGGR